MKRILEVIPGLISWSLILLFLLSIFFNPLFCAILIIVYLLYWVCRLLYMSILLVMSSHRVLKKKDIDWLSLCKKAKGHMSWEDVCHIVLFTTFYDEEDILRNSLISLKEINYPKDKLIIVLAGEERENNIKDKLERIRGEFISSFKEIIITIHPKNIKGEIPCKGANATYSARCVKKFLEENKIPLKRVIISCFDSDTQVHPNYFACLTYQFLTSPYPYNTSFQPFPVYTNNFLEAPLFARVVEMGSTFWQLIESMRYEKFITFSSHSMSFKTLTEVDYWPTDMISDDSLIYWKCFLKFRGNYHVYPLEVPVYMDIAVGKSLWDTIRIQYSQKRRWAWGVENFIFLGMNLLKRDINIPLSLKIRKMFQILDNHINWATWSIIITYIFPFIFFWNRRFHDDLLIMFNVRYINNIILNSLIIIIFLCIFISRKFIVVWDKKVTFLNKIVFYFQWLFLPFVSAVLGSLPALDAQTRLMLGKYLYFNLTQKYRKSKLYNKM